MKIRNMKVKILKQFRKYWEYKIRDGKVYIRRKCDGYLLDFDNVSSAVSWIGGRDFVPGYILNRRYVKKARIRDKTAWIAI